MNPSPALQTVIAQKLTTHFSFTGKINFSLVGGGSINDTYRISVANQSVFCKINSATKFPHLFQTEKAGLSLLAQTGNQKTPQVIDCFEMEGFQFLLLEWIEPGIPNESFWKTFGERLAALHSVTGNGFGLAEDNYMGSVPQQNNQHDKWCSFFMENRLFPLMKKCSANNLLSSKDCSLLENLATKLPNIFNKEEPSLLHGDLWSGNFLCTEDFEPVLIDPAVYYGHRSVDMAMTTLFGGFQQSFYEAYHYHYPLPSNYKEQWTVCNIYPLLIHLYLFGTSYLPSIRNTLQQFS
ncbi:fructosamine kinase family protein [Flavisolibacter sp. BT320]|nr:fructosamine kinase family protein [Flavisolibacter longurius]